MRWLISQLKNRREPSIDVVSPVGAREVGPTRGEDGEVLQRRLQLRLQRAPGGHAREQPGVPEVRRSHRQGAEGGAGEREAHGRGECPDGGGEDRDGVRAGGVGRAHAAGGGDGAGRKVKGKRGRQVTTTRVGFEPPTTNCRSAAYFSSRPEL